MGLSPLRIGIDSPPRINAIAHKLDLPPEWLVKLALEDQIRKEKINFQVS